jgi:hypothetical protein
MYIYSSSNSFLHCNFTDIYNGVYFAGYDTNIIQNNIIDYCNFSGGNSYGLNFNFAYNNTISNTSVSFIGEAGDGIYMVSSSYNKFYNINVDMTYGYSLYLQNSSYNNFIHCWFNYTDYSDGLYLTSNSHDNYFFDVNVSNAGYYSTYYQVRITFSSDNTFENCSIYTTTSYGLRVESSTNIIFINSDINAPIQGHINLTNSAELILLNTDYDPLGVKYLDTLSTFLYQNYLTLRVLDNYDNAPVPNANVVVKNVTFEIVGNVFTGLNGYTPPIPTNYFKNQDFSGNGIIEVNEQIFYNPHNVTATHPFYYQGWAFPEPLVDQNLLVTLKL